MTDTLTTPSFTFEDAAPVKRRGGPGRAVEPNPFVEVMQSIALQTDDEGQPLAKTFKIKLDPETDDGQKQLDKILRQLASAGALTTPQVRVNKAYEVKSGNFGRKETTITFWTTEKSAHWTQVKKERETGATPEPHVSANTPETGGSE